MPGAVRERDHVHPFGERSFRCSRGTDGAARLTAIRADTNGDSNERSIVRGFGRAARGTRRASLRVGVRRSTPGHAETPPHRSIDPAGRDHRRRRGTQHVDAREPARRPVCRATRLLEHTYIKEGPGGGCRGHVPERPERETRFTYPGAVSFPALTRTTPSPRCTTPSRRGTSGRVPDRRRRAGPATDARHPRASWPRDAVYAAGTPVVIVVMVVVGGVIKVVVPVIVAIDQAPAALGGRLRGHSADGLLGGCQRIAGTREDWPGGARTLTPREPTREPNGTIWSGPSSIRTATRSGSASPSQDHYSPALLRVSSHRQLPTGKAKSTASRPRSRP